MTSALRLLLAVASRSRSLQRVRSALACHRFCIDSSSIRKLQRAQLPSLWPISLRCDLLHDCVAGFAMSNISVIIPALNEQEPIAGVVRECLATGLPDEVIVVDNGSTDRTAARSREAGARVVTAPRGYGH